MVCVFMSGKGRTKGRKGIIRMEGKELFKRKERNHLKGRKGTLKSNERNCSKRRKRTLKSNERNCSKRRKGGYKVSKVSVNIYK